MQKFSEAKTEKSDAEKAALKERKTWSPRQQEVASELHRATEFLLTKAEATTAKSTSKIPLSVEAAPEQAASAASSKSSVSASGGQKEAMVELLEYEPETTGLAAWVGLYKALKQVRVEAANLHRICFFGKSVKTPVCVILSAHNVGGSADFLVHDVKAKLVVEGGEVVPPEELRVSYRIFEKKIEALKAHRKTDDATIAGIMLSIIKNPLQAPKDMENFPEDLQLFTELVTTWMLAEPVRHKSEMLSGVMELQLIKAGKRTFRQSLGTDATGGTHPMSQGKSLAQGRRSEAHEADLGGADSKTPDETPGKPTQKQVAQFEGDDVRKTLEALLGEYLPAVEKVVAAEQAGGASGSEKEKGDSNN